jgi:hypothetical protein
MCPSTAKGLIFSYISESEGKALSVQSWVSHGIIQLLTTPHVLHAGGGVHKLCRVKLHPLHHMLARAMLVFKSVGSAVGDAVSPNALTRRWWITVPRGLVRIPAFMLSVG